MVLALSLPLPARWPYSRVLNGVEPGDSVAGSLEVVQRLVPPEAQNYFQRILKVTESELQKLLIHKVQNLFDPIAELPRAAHENGLSKQRLLKEKPTIEGQHLSAYIVTVLSRILVDFSRFADLVLRWQQNEREKPQKPRRPATANDASDRPEQLDWQVHCQPILDRLERQDQQNTELELKCSKTLSELRERTRQFLRERTLFRERLKMIRQHALRVRDEELLQLLDHEVQFYDEQEEGLEDVKERYEKKLLEQEVTFKASLKNKDFDINVLKGKVAGLEKAARELKERKMADKVGLLTQKLEKAEKTIEEIDSELQFSQDENRRWRSEHNGLLKQLEDAKMALQEKLLDFEAQSSELSEIREEASKSRDEVQRLEAELASVKAALAMERARVEEEQKRREMQEMQRAREREEEAKAKAKKLVKQVLRNEAQSVAPDDRLERAEAELGRCQEELRRLREALELQAAQREREQREQRQREQREQREAEKLRAAEAAQAAEAEAARVEAARAAAAEAVREERAASSRASARALEEELEASRAREAQLAERLAALEALQGQGGRQESPETHRAGVVAEEAVNPGALALDVDKMDQWQQTDGEPMEDPTDSQELQNLRADLQTLQAREAKLLQTVAALQEELRNLMSQAPRPSETDPDVAPWEVRGLGLLRIESYQGQREEYEAKALDVQSDVSKMFDYPRVMSMGGGWLQGVSKMHEQLPFQPHSSPSREEWPPRGRSPHLEDHMPAELTARWSCQRSPSPLQMAKAKRSTVCRSPPRLWSDWSEGPHPTSPAPAAAAAPAAPVAPAPSASSKRGHPLGHPLLGASREAEAHAAARGERGERGDGVARVDLSMGARAARRKRHAKVKEEEAERPRSAAQPRGRRLVE